MHLQRIQVPDFRVLKNVDLVFEKDFSPKIFPLGSQNGGGKSTLLQLIFVLLHCAFEPNRLLALKNLLNHFPISENDRKVLATINLIHEDQEVELEFFACSDAYIEQLITEETTNTKNSPSNNTSGHLRFSMLPVLGQIKEKIDGLTKERFELEKVISELENIAGLGEVEKRFQLSRSSKSLKRFIGSTKYQEKDTFETVPIGRLQKEATEQLDRIRDSCGQLNAKYIHLSSSVDRIIKLLKSNNLVYICNYSSDSDRNESPALICKVDKLGMEKANLFLNRVSNKVFLAAPSTQVFLFLQEWGRKLLFRSENKAIYGENYYSYLNEAKFKMPGLFTYDFLEVDLLIDAFKAARDEDFRKKIKTGEYGNAYSVLVDSLNSLLTNKRINLNPDDFSEVTFSALVNGQAVELYPEDLSHGELKRLSIYLWLKYLKIEDAIVLMDEIEIALHPDWQYRIVTDLYQWAPTNQYILATHSYELCQAVTPAHVKELEPRLLNNRNNPYESESRTDKAAL